MIYKSIVYKFIKLTCEKFMTIKSKSYIFFECQSYQVFSFLRNNEFFSTIELIIMEPVAEWLKALVNIDHMSRLV